MFPLYDDIRAGALPLMTLLIIIACTLVWIFVQGMGQEVPLATSLCLSCWVWCPPVPASR